MLSKGARHDVPSNLQARKRSLDLDEPGQTRKRQCPDARGSTLKSKGTPSKLADWVRARQSPKTEPAKTPLASSAVKKASVQTPLQLKDTVVKLPANYALLVQMFGKLQTVYLLYKRRNQRCTFQNAKQPVEACCGRDFLMKHLLQMAGTLPEVLQLSCTSAKLPPTPGGSAKSEAQTFIDMPKLAERGGSQPALQEWRQELANRLLAFAQTHHRSEHPQCWTESDTCKCKFNLETFPDPPAAPLPQPEAVCGSPASPALSAPHTPATAHPRPTPLSSSRKPPTGPRSSRPLAKRLSFGPKDPAEQPGVSETSSRAPAVRLADILEEDASSGAKEARMAKELRRQSMDGSIPVSLQALQAVQQASEEQAAMFNAEAVAARRHATAAALLPKTFDSIRAVFGPSGPSVMQLQKVIQKLSGGSDKAQQEELRFQIQRLAESLPDFLTLEYRPVQGEVLRLNRSLDAKIMREQLNALSE